VVFVNTSDTIPLGKTTNKFIIQEETLQTVLDLPRWKRLPSNLHLPDVLFQPSFDPFNKVIERLRMSSDRFRACGPEPHALGLLHGDSRNELANTISSVTYPNPSRRTEKLAYQWYCYMITRV
jgi:hypothetical protein